MSGEGVVKIADMGIGKITHKTIHTETCAGTDPYMSPQLHKNCIGNEEHKYSFGTDIWYKVCFYFFLIKVV